MAAPTITDSVSAVGTGASVTTGNLTVASGDRLYVAVLMVDGAGPGGVTSVTSSGGGGALSSIGDSGVAQSYTRAHIWRSTSPTAGTVTVTATPSVSTEDIAVIAVSVAGAASNGTAAFTSGTGTADAVSSSISSSTDAIVLDFINRIQGGAMSITGGQTQLEQIANGAATVQSGSSVEAGAASVTTSWGFNSAGTVVNWEWVLGAISISGAAGGATKSHINGIAESTISHINGIAKASISHINGLTR